jgi:S1-C subfamily serine protease
VLAEEESSRQTVEAVPRVGTAFVVAPNQLLTAYHAVETYQRLFISTERDGLFTAARVVAYDKALDIALIEASVEADPVVFGAWESVPLGVDVSVVGFPKIGEIISGKRITAGIINGERLVSAQC